MLFQDVLNANSPLPAITDGGRYIGGTVWMLCCVAASDWLQAYHLGWGGRWGKHYEELGSSAPLGHDLVHPDVFEFLRSENWRTCSRHIFSRQTNTFFFIFIFYKGGGDGSSLAAILSTQKWNWVLYLLMYKWRHVKDVLCTVISKYNLYSKSTGSRYYPNSYSWCL